MYSHGAVQLMPSYPTIASDSVHKYTRSQSKPIGVLLRASFARNYPTTHAQLLSDHACRAYAVYVLTDGTDLKHFAPVDAKRTVRR